MRSFFIAMSILTFLIVGGLSFDYCLNNTTNTLLSSCDEIDKDIRDSKFKDAYNKVGELSEYIDINKPLLSSILDHSSIDEIEKEISTLLGYTEKADPINSVVGIKNLKHMLKHLPENYTLKLQNIL